MATQIIVVPDDDDAINKAHIPPNILTALNQGNVIMSNDNLRMYVRYTMYKNMLDAAKLMEK